MSVYVDTLKTEYRGMKMSHMMADTLPELHAMAEAIGLKREWFQPKSSPHYDLCQSKRALAITKGAIEVSPREMVELIRKQRTKSKPEIPDEEREKIARGEPSYYDNNNYPVNIPDEAYEMTPHKDSYKTWQEAMTDAKLEAQLFFHLVYVIKKDELFYVQSKYAPDYFGKAYPGGRSELSRWASKEIRGEL